MFSKEPPSIKKLKEIMSKIRIIYHDLEKFRQLLSIPIPKQFIKKYQIAPHKLGKIELSREEYRNLIRFKIVQFIRWSSDIKKHFKEIETIIEELSKYKNSPPILIRESEILRNRLYLLSETLIWSEKEHIKTLNDSLFMSIPTVKNSTNLADMFANMFDHLTFIFQECNYTVQKLQKKKNIKFKNINEISDADLKKVRTIRNKLNLINNIEKNTNEVVQLQNTYTEMLDTVDKIIEGFPPATQSDREKGIEIIELMIDNNENVIFLIKKISDSMLSTYFVGHTSDAYYIRQYCQFITTNRQDVSGSLDEVSNLLHGSTLNSEQIDLLQKTITWVKSQFSVSKNHLKNLENRVRQLKLHVI